MSALPAWMHPPNGTRWTADDMDRLPPEAPRHVELIDGALIFRMAPQRIFHSRVKRNPTSALAAQAPVDIGVDEEMTVRLDDIDRTRLQVAVPFPIDIDLAALMG
ncbi:hypothetical protein ACFZBU_00275 [Embleya sp. NPDC008237]|uniref:hypothetical protein n=1 Tax=Embleya sp. NPDC008237 TaxID=3363978 RepID=UPI0036EC8F75